MPHCLGVAYRGAAWDESRLFVGYTVGVALPLMSYPLSVIVHLLRGGPLHVSTAGVTCFRRCLSKLKSGSAIEQLIEPFSVAHDVYPGSYSGFHTLERLCPRPYLYRNSE